MGKVSIRQHTGAFAAKSLEKYQVFPGLFGALD